MDSQNNAPIKIDVYEIVTNRIIELLEAGTVPWQKPWTDGGIPKNLISKRPYRGINLWLLLSLPYERHLYLTWDQLKKFNASVNKGETGHIVAFWKNLPKKPEELDGRGNPKLIPMLRYYKVFNVSQCRDIPENLIEPLIVTEHHSLDECEAIIKGMQSLPVIRHKENKAYYNIAEDFINMPKQKSFKTAEGYYQTLFHELVHATGAEKRLGRKTLVDMVKFGDQNYSQEELVAEMGASYLSSLTGILDTTIQNSIAYISGWLSKLRDDKKFIIQASGQAQKAVDLITNRQEIEVKDEVEESIEESEV